MPRTIRFHLDEHCDPAIASGLRLHGVDVTTTPEAGLLHARDEIRIAYAVASGRVIFTQDRDYLRHHATGMEYCDIAFCYQNSRSIGQIIASLLLIWESYEPDEMRDRVEFIEPRQRPLGSRDRSVMEWLPGAPGNRPADRWSICSIGC
jgi:predicted nuclease of predicted toxin-antitoxin system